MAVRSESPRRRPLAALRTGALGVALLAALSIAAAAAPPAGQPPPSASSDHIVVPAPDASRRSDEKPYDQRLSRLAEIMGAVHYLRELCGANDGQLWRNRMQELLDGEAATPARRARLSRSFNQGYRAFSRTYSSCSGSAQTTIARFLSEGAQLADTLSKTQP